MKLDNFYFVVSDIGKSIEFYSALLDKQPTNFAIEDYDGNKIEIACYDKYQ